MKLGTCLGINLALATTVTIRFPKATFKSQAACITDCIRSGACKMIACVITVNVLILLFS